MLISAEAEATERKQLQCETVSGQTVEQTCLNKGLSAD